MTKCSDSGKYVSVKKLKERLKVSDESNIDIPAIEITRCGDCEWWWRENEVCAEEHHVIDGICGVDVSADDFCSYGEPKK